MPAKKKSLAAKRKPASTIKPEDSLNFAALVDSIRQVHEQSAAHVNRTVNTTLTLRNWVIGAYIHHDIKYRMGCGAGEEESDA